MSTLKPGAPKIEKHPISGILHVYNIDWDDNGILREVAVVKELSDGTIRGILVDQLHAIDRKRYNDLLLHSTQTNTSCGNS